MPLDAALALVAGAAASASAAAAAEVALLDGGALAVEVALALEEDDVDEGLSFEHPSAPSVIAAQATKRRVEEQTGQ